MDFIAEIKKLFKGKGNGLMQLIVINTGIFILVNLLKGIFSMAGINTDIPLEMLALPSQLSVFVTHFWTIVTYMFLHFGFFHILFNMLWLYWMGTIFVEYLGSKKLISTYILGGLSGGLFYLVTYNVFPNLPHSYLLGASAGVMAIIIAIATLVPNYTVHLMFIGPVKLKYIALFAFVLSSILDISVNTGGKISHIGGAIFGFLYIRQYQKGHDIARGFNRFMDSLVSFFKSKPRPPKMKVAYKSKKRESDIEYNARKQEEQKKIDEILDKISKSGYESLTKEEKEILFKMSQDK